MNKLRMTPNAWSAALFCLPEDVRSWIESKAQVNTTCVNIEVDPTDAMAAKMLAALGGGQFVGRTKGAIQKLIEALSALDRVRAPGQINLAAPLGACAGPTSDDVIAPPAVNLAEVAAKLQGEEQAKLQNMLATVPANAPAEIVQAVKDRLATVQAGLLAPPVAVAVLPKTVEKVDAEMDLVMNPRESIRDAMKSLANSLKE